LVSQNSPFFGFSRYFLLINNAQNCTLLNLLCIQACLDSECKATIVQARRVEAGDVSAAGGLLSLTSSVGGTGVSSSTVSMSSELAFVPDASGAVTVRRGVALQGSIATHVHITEAQGDQLDSQCFIL
jgi:hypothetical protein